MSGQYSVANVVTYLKRWQVFRCRVNLKKIMGGQP
mgnify:CR=1 FL=1